MTRYSEVMTANASAIAGHVRRSEHDQHPAEVERMPDDRYGPVICSASFPRAPADAGKLECVDGAHGQDDQREAGKLDHRVNGGPRAGDVKQFAADRPPEQADENQEHARRPHIRRIEGSVGTDARQRRLDRRRARVRCGGARRPKSAASATMAPRAVAPAGAPRAVRPGANASDPANARPPSAG